MKYRKREMVDAVQWFKPGDHEDVRQTVHGDYWCTPHINTFDFSGRKWVKPGDWIITHADGTHEVCKVADFEREYEMAGVNANNQAFNCLICGHDGIVGHVCGGETP